MSGDLPKLPIKTLIALTLLASTPFEQGFAQSVDEPHPPYSGSIMELDTEEWFFPRLQLTGYSMTIKKPDSGEKVSLSGPGLGFGLEIPLNGSWATYLNLLQNLSTNDKLAGLSARTSYGLSLAITGQHQKRKKIIATSSGSHVEINTTRDGGLRWDFGCMYEHIMTSQSVGVFGFETTLRWEFPLPASLLGIGLNVSTGQSPFLETTASSLVVTWGRR